jgi:hypothetical protein
MKRIIILLSVCALCGCENREVMRERFGDNARILKDERGRAYLVRHQAGQLYFVSPYDSDQFSMPK